MSLDFNYEWLDPIDSEGESIPWYSSFGLEGGRLGVFTQDVGSDGRFTAVIHKPVFFSLPLYAGGGPEGGVVCIATWFLGAVLSAAVVLGARIYKLLRS